MDLSTILNVLYGYFDTKTNKLIWTGSLEDLKALVLTEVDDEVTAQRITWRSLRGGKWSFESKVLTITNMENMEKLLRIRKLQNTKLMNRLENRIPASAYAPNT